MRIRLLRAAVLSLRTRRGGGHGRSDGVDITCAVVRGWVQDVDDGAGVAVRTDPRGKLLAVVKLCSCEIKTARHCRVVSCSYCWPRLPAGVVGAILSI